jgi:hypothetical protein
MKPWICAAAAGVCIAGAAAAQQTPQATTVPAAEQAPVAEPAPWARSWYVYSGLSSMYVSNINHTPAGLGSYGTLLSVGGQYRGRFDRVSMDVEYHGVYRQFTNTDVWDRPGHVASGSLAFRVSRQLAVGLDGEVSINGYAEDLVIRNEYSVQPELEWRFDRRNRLQLYGEYLLKRYPDSLTARDAVTPRVGVKFRQVLGESKGWSVGVRYEYNRADSSRYQYDGWTAGLDVTNPVGAKGRISSSVRYRIRGYDSRLIQVGDTEALRRDQTAVATLGWEHLLGRSWSLALSYRFEASTSNDVRREYEDHRFGMTLRRWW